MKPNINFHGVCHDPEVENYILRRCAFAFSRMQHAIERTSVTMTDVNGPKGGIDKQCRIVIKPEAMSPIVVSEQQSTLKLAVDRAIARASRSLARQLKRRQTKLRFDPERRKLWN